MPYALQAGAIRVSRPPPSPSPVLALASLPLLHRRRVPHFGHSARVRHHGADRRILRGRARGACTGAVVLATRLDNLVGGGEEDGPEGEEDDADERVDEDDPFRGENRLPCLKALLFERGVWGGGGRGGGGLGPPPGFRAAGAIFLGTLGLKSTDPH